MSYFTSEFLNGLATKSQIFQNKFHEIMDDICDYIDTESEKREFLQGIESKHSYDKPGNMLYSTKTQYCGKHHDSEELKERISFFLLRLFDAFESEEAVNTVPHIVICVSAASDVISEKDMKFFKSLIAFERLYRGSLIESVTTVLSRDTERLGTSCYVAALK